MKHLLLLLFLFPVCSLADPLSASDEKKLQEIVELFKSKSYEEAIRRLTLHETMLVEVVEKSEDASAYTLLGQAYFYAEMDSKAKNAFRSALRYDSSLSDAHFFIGLIHLYASDLENAERSFRNAIDLNSNNEDYFVELGKIVERKNIPLSALAEYRRALAIDETNFSANFHSANIYANAGDNEKAEAHYLAALKKEPDDINCNFNLGRLYQNTSQHRFAIRYFSKVVDQDGTDWRAIEKIIQENEALGETEARDIAIENIYDLWSRGATDELQERGFFIREQKKIEAGKLFVLEYFKMQGERPRKFVIKLQDSATGTPKFDVSLGSYDETTQLARELGDIGADERIYHLDGYAPNGSHYTYVFFSSLPDYEVVRELALKVLAGQLEAISSTRLPNTTDSQEANQ